MAYQLAEEMTKINICKTCLGYNYNSQVFHDCKGSIEVPTWALERTNKKEIAKYLLKEAYRTHRELESHTSQ